MENPNTELSGRTPAFVSWIQVIGLIIFLISRLSFFSRISWLLYPGVALILLAYSIRTYLDWKQGNKKAFRRRLIFLLIAFAAGLVAGYLATTSH